MSRVALLGLGAMGERMAQRLLAAGHTLTVWNRNPERAAALRLAGARVAPSPAAAAADAEIALAMVRDDEASRRVWLDPIDGALPVLASDAVAVDSSTLTVRWVGELARAARARGLAFVDAPVVGSRPQAEAGQLVHLVGGEAADLERIRPLLNDLGTAIHHLGPNGAGAALKLIVNGLLGVQAVAMAEALGMMDALGLDSARAGPVLEALPVVSPAARGLFAAMRESRFAPMFPVALVDKDLGYLLAEARAAGAGMPVADAARIVFSAALEHGMGEQNLSGIVRLFR
ncbi:NAD(P)-dependent oxidoreductase [Methyloversatilis sp.]|uniref:NAD(P)-dependent oxidoreductase n=1 Tax=Methyloversatilis sp. TaxID=2569862 RepID=UPI0035B46490